jgi:hypothetical protein
MILREPSHAAERRSLWWAGLLLALLPAASIVSQYVLSLHAGTESCFFQNYTVAYVDWVFVPFNLLVVWRIDWQRGGALFVMLFLSVVANIVGHAIWQYHGIDGGHMIARDTQVVLPAGWLHLGFSIVQATLILGFIFVRRTCTPFSTITTFLALLFFLAAGVSGYIINHGFMATDVMMVSSGIVLVTFYPFLRNQWADWRASG